MGTWADARAPVLFELAKAARMGKPAPSYATLAKMLGVTTATISDAVLWLKRMGKIRVIERRWPSFMRYEVIGIGTTGERPPCLIPTSWNFRRKPKPPTPTG